MILPLALAQFIASYAATNMNVAISAIATDLGTTVAGVQTAITLFTLTMAALMIPGSKLTDIWGRKRCFIIGLAVYGVGALLALLSQGLPLLIVGYSLLEGVGSALMIPPIYILVTVAFPDVKSRARYFGVVSGAGGLGAAAGPLIGGVVTTAISWRASFGLQVLVVAWIACLGRKITEPARPGLKPRFDLTGAVCRPGLLFVVLGLLQSRTYGFFKSRADFTIGNTVVIPKGRSPRCGYSWPSARCSCCGSPAHPREREERQGRPAAAAAVPNKISNLGLGTQVIQWLILQGSFFTVSVLRTTLPPQLRLNDARPVLFVVLLGLIVALILSDPGRIDRQATWLRVLTALPIGLITIPNGGATLRLVAAILFGEPFTQSARACSRPVRSSG